MSNLKPAFEIWQDDDQTGYFSATLEGGKIIAETIFGGSAETEWEWEAEPKLDPSERDSWVCEDLFARIIKI